MTAPPSAGQTVPEHPSDRADPGIVRAGASPAEAPARPWYSRLWSGLRSRFARQIALAAVMAGAIAAGGHFVGGLVGWWHAYELTFGGHDADKPAAESTRGKAAAAALSIVVLPFANEGAAEDGWFAENLANDVGVELSRLAGSSVIARESAGRYRGRDVDPREVARELNVRYVLAGSVHRQGDRVRLRLRLVDGETGAQRWTDRFDVDRVALPALIDTVAGRIARGVNVEMHRAAGQVAGRLPRELAKADDVAMRGWGLYFTGGFDRANTLSALALFEQAVAMDARSVYGWGGIASALARARGPLWVDPATADRRLVEATAQLERLAPESLYLWVGRWAQALYVRRDVDGALEVANQWVERFPGHRNGYLARSAISMRLDRFAEALADTETAIALSPLADDLGNSQGRMSWLLYAQGRHAEAVEWGRKSVASATGNPVFGATLAAALVRTGQPELGRQALREVLERRPDFSAGSLRKMIPEGRGPKFSAARDDFFAALREIGLE